jgi:hypothetical protein
MKKLFTILALVSIVQVPLSSQAFVLQIDSLRIFPYNPDQNDSIKFLIYGSCNYDVALESPITVLNDQNGDTSIINACYMVGHNPGIYYFRDTAYLSTGLAGPHNVQWTIQYNQTWWNVCDGNLSVGSMNYNVTPVAVYAHTAPGAAATWDASTSTLEFSGFVGKLTIDIYDVNGKAMRMQRVSADDEKVLIAGLNPGIYLIWITDENGVSVRQKIFVK